MTTHRPNTETLTVPVETETLRDCPDGKSKRRFRMLAYTGSVVDRLYGDFVIDLEGIEFRDKVPMLVDHDGGKIAGYADRMETTDEGLQLSGVLSGATEYGRLVADLSDEGFPWQASVGISVLEREEIAEGTPCSVNGLELMGPVSIARKCKLLETSFLYSGADSDTYAVALAAQQKEAPVADAKETAPAVNLREELKAFLAAFPGEEALAATRYAEGKTLTEVELEIARRDSELLVEARAEVENLKAEVASLKEELATIKALDTAAGNPGVGFDGTVRQGESLKPTAPTTYAEAWTQSESLRAEFGNDEKAFSAYCKRERPTLKELI